MAGRDMAFVVKVRIDDEWTDEEARLQIDRALNRCHMCGMDHPVTVEIVAP